MERPALVVGVVIIHWALVLLGIKVFFVRIAKLAIQGQAHHLNARGVQRNLIILSSFSFYF